MQIDDKELQEISDYVETSGWSLYSKEMVRKLLSTIEGLKEEAEQLKQVFSYDSAVTIIRLQKEVERYRTALEEMAGSDDEWYVGTTSMREYAKKALGNSHDNTI